MGASEILQLVSGLQKLGVTYFKSQEFEVHLAPSADVYVPAFETAREDPPEQPVKRWKGYAEEDLFPGQAD